MDEQTKAEAWQAPLQRILAYYGTGEGVLLPILHALQAEISYLPVAADAVIAEALNLSRAEIAGTISFYPDLRREPLGRHVLRLCRAEACQTRGADALARWVRQELTIGWDETTPDGAISLQPVFCLGLCAGAPCAEFDGRSLARIDQDGLLRVMKAARE